MAPKLKGLGRGLDALLSGNKEPAPSAAASTAPTRLPISALRAGKYQPRTLMDEPALDALADSIKGQGLIQPILVRPLKAADGKVTHEIIAGERRFRAAQRAGLTDVPVTVRDVADNDALAMALIENIQRENLNPLEEAQGIQRLTREFGLTHEEAAKAVGRSRSAVTNLLRLTQLPQPVQDLVYAGKLDMGHARALLAPALADNPAHQVLLANQVVADGLSVRETEARAAKPLFASDAAKRPSKGNLQVSTQGKANNDLRRFEEDLSERLGTTVKVKPGKRGAGQLIIDYANNEHLDGLLARIQ
jgi:ParB family transcriptional regulator, chromosome partitioning protein